MKQTILLIFLSFMAFGQGETDIPIELKPTDENFRRAMAITNPTSLQIDTLIELSVEYSFTNEDSCVALGNRAVELSENHDDQHIYAKALMELGDTYRIFGRLDEGEDLLNQAKSIYEELGDQGQMAHCNNKLGALNVNKSNYELAIPYYLSALEIWESLKDSQNIIKPYINIGVVFKNINRHNKAQEYYEEALKWADILNDNRAKMYVYNNQAIVYNAEANKYQNLADSDSTRRVVYLDSSQYFIANSLAKYQQSVDLAKSINDKRSLVRALTNMTDLKATMGLYDEALAHSLEAEAISEDIGAVVSIVSLKANQAEVYRFLKRYNEGIQAGKEALALAKENDLGKFGASANLMLYLIYKETGQLSQALENHEAYNLWIRENGEIERNKAIAEVETRFQTVKKEKQILEQQNDILQLEESQAKIKRQRNYLLGSAVGLGLFGFLGMQLLRIRKDRNDKKAFAEALLYAQEEERKRIARDLHDGVGQSLLLIKKQLETTKETTLENQQMISDTLEEVRSISRDLHPFQLEKLGLTAAIEDVIEKVSKSSDIFVSKEIDNLDGRFSPKAEINIYRTIQEGLTNVLKHAKATAVKVSMKTQGLSVLISIQDNGKGFDPNLIESKSLGLRTMAERISAIGGSFKIEKGELNGTVISCVIPLTEEKI
jgi:signal transduction histidine kinase